ncbi:MAG: transposase [Candidatus Tectimicrobiota bacterium]|nr:MAG: transposase [Candidatus Tectomicrobia bacterium]
MPRIPRGQMAGYAYHVINRGNARAPVFHKAHDYEAFVELLARAKARHPVRLFAFCLMPNHFHLLLEPASSTALSQFMQWLLTSHVRRYHHHYQSSGHVWQGRFKSFPIQRDEHLLTVLRYIVQNPVRAGLVAQAGEWPWSSLRWRHLVDPWPLGEERAWETAAALPLAERELEAVRECVKRQRPFGAQAWQAEVARHLGLEATLRPRGRPRHEAKK